MIYTIERTEDEILIKLPIGSTPKQVQNALNFLRYVELGIGNQVTEEQIDELVQESRGRWWEANKDRFRGLPGFEGMEE
jgi:hypothetical protein